jgi:cell division protein FtsB
LKSRKNGDNLQFLLLSLQLQCVLYSFTFFRNRIAEALERKVEQQQEQLKALGADKDSLERECERLKNERMVCVVQTCI